MKELLEIRTEEDFDSRFPDEASCQEYFFKMKWPNGPICPECNFHAKKIKTRREYQCQRTGCGKQTSLTAGTLMQDTKLPMRKWLLAIFYMIETLNSITGNEVARRLGVTEETGWYLLQRIRVAFGWSEDRLEMDGRVLIDRVSFEDAITTSAWTEVGLRNEDGSEGDNQDEGGRERAPEVLVLVERSVDNPDPALLLNTRTSDGAISTLGIRAGSEPKPEPRLRRVGPQEQGTVPVPQTEQKEEVGHSKGEPAVKHRRRTRLRRHMRDHNWVHFQLIDPVEGSEPETIIAENVAPEAQIVPLHDQAMMDAATSRDGDCSFGDNQIGGKALHVAPACEDDASVSQRIVWELKAWFTGVFRGSVGRHLQAYLDEYSFRYNRWCARACLFEMVVSRVAHTKPITYKWQTDYKGWLARHRAGTGPPREGRTVSTG